MQWSIKRTNDCNEMMRYYGCSSPSNEGSDRVKMMNEQLKIKAAYFQAALIFVAVKWLWNGRKNDWLEQHHGTKGTTGERPL